MQRWTLLGVVLWAFSLVFVPSTRAQVFNPSVIWVQTAPSGACSTFAPMELLISTNPPALYSCNSVTNMWVSPAGSQGPAGPAGPVGSACNQTGCLVVGNGSTTSFTLTTNFGTVTHAGPD